MQRYSSTVLTKQPGYWTLSLKPIALPPETPKTPARRPERSQGQPKVYPPSLMQFIAQSGGLNPDYNRGQWRHELHMIREAGKGVMPGVLNCQAGVTFEEMAQAACEAGYILEPDVDMLLWALAKDVEAAAYGERRNRVYGHGAETVVAELDYQAWSDAVDELAAA